jgi:hypothetical protein
MLRAFDFLMRGGGGALRNVNSRLRSLIRPMNQFIRMGMLRRNRSEVTVNQYWWRNDRQMTKTNVTKFPLSITARFVWS